MSRTLFYTTLYPLQQIQRCRSNENSLSSDLNNDNKILYTKKKKNGPTLLVISLATIEFKTSFLISEGCCHDRKTEFLSLLQEIPWLEISEKFKNLLLNDVSECH